MPHNYISKLQIQKADGTFYATEGEGTVVFADGINTSISKDTDGSIKVSALAITADNPYYLHKYNTIISPAGGSKTVLYPGDVGPNYTFSGTSAGLGWISKINNSVPVDNMMPLKVDSCYHAGDFDTTAYAQTSASLLKILDTCAACLDCADFKKLGDLIDKLDLAIDQMLHAIIDPGGTLDKYLALVERWNQLAHLKAWKFNTEATGNQISAACKYVNTGLESISGVQMEIDFTDVFASYPTSRAVVIDTAVTGIARTDLTTSIAGLVATVDVNVPLLPGEGLRFYAACIVDGYSGEDFSTTSRFEVKFRISGPPFGSLEKTMNTNKLVYTA